MGKSSVWFVVNALMVLTLLIISCGPASPATPTAPTTPGTPDQRETFGTTYRRAPATGDSRGGKAEIRRYRQRTAGQRYY
jgi:hypothetical protein